MLYKFKSPASADVIMTKGPAEDLLKVIGKSPAPTGIITLEQIPVAIEAIRAEVKRLNDIKAELAAQEKLDEPHKVRDAESEAVDFSQRATPFIRLLELTRAAGKPVVWGV